MELCKHDNYHCNICEIELLKNVIEEQKKEIEKLNNHVDHYRKDSETKQGIISKLQMMLKERNSLKG